MCILELTSQLILHRTCESKAPTGQRVVADTLSQSSQFATSSALQLHKLAITDVPSHYSSQSSVQSSIGPEFYRASDAPEL